MKYTDLLALKPADQDGYTIPSQSRCERRYYNTSENTFKCSSLSYL